MILDKDASSPPPYNPPRHVLYYYNQRIPDPLGVRARLYRRPSDQTPIDDAAEMSILGASAIASTPGDALVLVFMDELTAEEKGDVPQIEGAEAREVEVGGYVYYHLYTRSGEDESTRAFDPDELAIGRIDRSTIAPPRDALEIKRRIAGAEGKSIYAFAELYAHVSGAPLADDGCCTGPPGIDFPGSNAKNALLIVQPERRAGLYNRPLKILQAQPSPSVLQVNHFSPPPLSWLEVLPGDIPGAWHMRSQVAYTVVNASGVKGLIKAGTSTPSPITQSSYATAPTENVLFLDE
ncbi:hypothetical protein DFH08DRAFT_1082595 [Mycena albidolilacea]|uniref:Uncharacterized protein n=1 Tax=Mycena albidolilacea TaxID=1033008 RepID=A0AAD6ZTU3_9AGAR|nr:hypothetical protein DFH08DRAFT_1082595 [Mycena albidolilacea]